MMQFDSARWMQDSGGVWLCLRVTAPAAAKEFCGTIQPKLYDADLKVHREKRSLDANAYFHVLVGKIAEAMGIGFEETKTNLVVEYGAFERDEDGVKFGAMISASADITKIYRYVKLFDTREVDGKIFNCYLIFKHTHLLDSKEMGRLIDGAVQEAKQLDIETLPPDKLDAMKLDWRKNE